MPATATVTLGAPVVRVQGATFDVWPGRPFQPERPRSGLQLIYFPIRAPYPEYNPISGDIVCEIGRGITPVPGAHGCAGNLEGRDFLASLFERC